MEQVDDDYDNNNNNGDAKDADENEDVDNGGEALPNFFKVIFFLLQRIDRLASFQFWLKVGTLKPWQRGREN